MLKQELKIAEYRSVQGFRLLIELRRSFQGSPEIILDAGKGSPEISIDAGKGQGANPDREPGHLRRSG